jgi:hypothetical protein
LLDFSSATSRCPTITVSASVPPAPYANANMRAVHRGRAASVVHRHNKETHRDRRVESMHPNHCSTVETTELTGHVFLAVAVHREPVVPHLHGVVHEGQHAHRDRQFVGPEVKLAAELSLIWAVTLNGKVRAEVTSSSYIQGDGRGAYIEVVFGVEVAFRDVGYGGHHREC